MTDVSKRAKENMRNWVPLKQLRPDQLYRRPEVVAEAARHYGISLAEAEAIIDQQTANCAYFINNIYQVEVSRMVVNWFGAAKPMAQLSVRRRDGAMLWDWRHLQQIKNELLGDEYEGLQLFPAESRKVDTCNKWAIWVLLDGTKLPFGWQEREVKDAGIKGVPGLRQRPL
jgi:hypothetical protein